MIDFNLHDFLRYVLIVDFNLKSRLFCFDIRLFLIRDRFGILFCWIIHYFNALVCLLWTRSCLFFGCSRARVGCILIAIRTMSPFACLLRMTCSSTSPFVSRSISTGIWSLTEGHCLELEISLSSSTHTPNGFLTTQSHTLMTIASPPPLSAPSKNCSTLMTSSTKLFRHLWIRSAHASFQLPAWQVLFPTVAAQSASDTSYYSEC